MLLVFKHVELFYVEICFQKYSRFVRFRHNALRKKEKTYLSLESITGECKNVALKCFETVFMNYPLWKYYIIKLTSKCKFPRYTIKP